MKREEMISFEKAYDIVMESWFETGSEIVDMDQALGRILAEDVASDTDMPPFNKASVDGFACRRNDLDSDLEIIETIPAGKWPEKELSPFKCSRIMTGASVPPGADCVIMVEDTEILPSGKIRYHGQLTRENISYRGEDIKNGETVLNGGRLIKSSDIAVLATVGHTSVRVARKPGIAVISSGNELVEPGEKPGISQIRNTNAMQLMAQIKISGGRGSYYGIARDDEQETLILVKKAISGNDIVLITGGVSMGDFDFVPSVLETAGVKILFSKIAVQPGKPTTFGVHPKAIVFGLPGNPVSSFLQFELLVKPLIYKMMGHDWKPIILRLPMKEKFSRKFAERMALIPVQITDDGLVIPVEYHGSAHISAIPDAYGLISLPAGISSIGKNEIVSVRQI